MTNIYYFRRSLHCSHCKKKLISESLNKQVSKPQVKRTHLKSQQQMIDCKYWLRQSFNIFQCIYKRLYLEHTFYPQCYVSFNHRSFSKKYSQKLSRTTQAALLLAHTQFNEYVLMIFISAGRQSKRNNLAADARVPEPTSIQQLFNKPASVKKAIKIHRFSSTYLFLL